jgi:putative two-component system response regulator
LAGEAIPESARIVAVVDVFDNMERGMGDNTVVSDETILELMREKRGKDFDPRIFDCFLDLFERMKTIRDELAEAESADRLQPPTTMW